MYNVVELPVAADAGGAVLRGPDGRIEYPLAGNVSPRTHPDCRVLSRFVLSPVCCSLPTRLLTHVRCNCTRSRATAHLSCSAICHQFNGGGARQVSWQQR